MDNHCAYERYVLCQVLRVIILKVAVRGRKWIFRILMRFFVTMLILLSYNGICFLDVKNDSKPSFGASEEK